jgi:hypothetical protein
MHQSHHGSESGNGGSWVFSRTGIATLVVVSVLAFLIYTGHSAHLMGALPYLLILLCPLTHIFLHGGAGGHGGRKHDEETNASDTQKESPGRTHSHGGC